MDIKKHIRWMLNILHLDLTKNLEYDRLTGKIMRSVLTESTNCIDIGCHKGEVLDSILKLSPKGTHFAFEPIPAFYSNLREQFEGRATVYPYALADESKTSTFQVVKNAPAYSGIKKRRYDIKNPDIEEIKVEIRRLDDIIPIDTPIGFIKIDVEGAELGVLKGAITLLKKWNPIVVFECGLGASDYYGTKAKDIYSFLTAEAGLRISTLKSFINSKPSLTLEQFTLCYEQKREYYFVAHRV